MEESINVENSLRSDLLRLHNELKGFHLRVIKLESENRSNQSEIRSLKSELNERKENEEKLKEKVDKLVVESEAVKVKLERLEEQVNDKNSHDDNNPAIGPISVPLSQDTGNNVLEMLDTLSTQIQTQFGTFGGKQGYLQREVDNLKQVIHDLGSPVTVKQAVSRSGSPTPLANHNDYYDDDDDDDIQILSPPILLTSIPTSSPSPPPPPPDVDAYAFVDQEGDGHITTTSPIPGPSTRRSNIRFSPYGNIFRGGTRKARLQTGSKWNLPHGYDHTDPSRLSCLCGTKLGDKRNLHWHIHYFTAEWQFSCDVCNKRFAKNNTMTEHKKRVHGIVAAETSYGCRYCGQIFHSSQEHRSHIRRCEKRISAQLSAKINAAIQQGNSGQGQGAGSTPPRASQARKRVVTPFKIKLRDANAAVRKLNFDQIKKEVMDPTDNEPGSLHGKDPTRKFTCLCDLKFQNDKGLIRHVRYHTIKRYRCRPCGKWFAYACYRNAHVLKAHKHQASGDGGSQLSQF